MFDVFGIVYLMCVFDLVDVLCVLIEGVNSFKIGVKVVKGWWVGMLIYMLMFEECVICLISCCEWCICYGNNMYVVWWLWYGEVFIFMFWCELCNKVLLYLCGFVVCFYVLGDFYSVDYVCFWMIVLFSLLVLCVFGFIVWGLEMLIGCVVVKMNCVVGDCSWIRFFG